MSSPSPSVAQPATQDVKARAQRSFVALGLRTLGSLGLRVVSSLALSRLLFPADYGAFAIVAFSASMGAYLGDLGLSAALVRQQHEPTDDEVATVFWCHQGFTALIVAGLLALAPLLARSYELGTSGVWMVVVMALGLFLSSLRVIPMMMLERHLHFPAVARAELVESVAQTAATIALAALHLGPWALIGGGVVRGVVGLGMLWAAAGWRPRGQVRWPVIQGLLGFGIWYQLNGIVPALLNGWVPLVVGKLAGKDAVGLTNWAWALASVPLALSTVLNRVAYPAYSRMQQDAEGLADYLRTSLRRVSAVLCVFVPFGIVALPYLVPAIFGERWAPASPLVQWFMVEGALQAVNGLLNSQQNASGHARERVYVLFGASVARCGLGALAVMHWGIVGIGVTASAVALTEVFVSAWLVARRNPRLSGLERQVLEPFLTVGALLAFAVGLARFTSGQSGLLTQALVGTAFLAALVVAREASRRGLSLWGELRAVVDHVRGRKAAP